MRVSFYLFITTLLFAGIILLSCEGPVGPQGPQGEQGKPGMVGPAGDDGSLIFAGEGPPPGEIGNHGDFYLDQTTGELYGPKNDGGWGDPIIVLAGEKGQDGEQGPEGPPGEDGEDGEQGPQGPQGPPGQDGEDGQDGDDGKDGIDGKDGSQIYAGNGPPNLSLGNEGDYYLDTGNYDLYGPKTGSGWGTPVNLQGPEGPAGTANVIYSEWTAISSASADTSVLGQNYKMYDIPAPGLSQEIIDKGSIQVYFRLNNVVLQLPTTFGSADPGFIVHVTFSSFQQGVLSILSQYLNNSAASLNPDIEIRYILIPGGVAAGKMQDSFWEDYEKVADYFAIPD